MRIMCGRDKTVAQILHAKLEEFTLTSRTERWSSRLQEDGVLDDKSRAQGTQSALHGGEGPTKAKRFLGDIIQIGEDVYARRNHRLTQIMQLQMCKRRKAVYAFLHGDTSFCLSAGRVKRLPPWNPYDVVPGKLLATFQWAPLHALLVSRSRTMSPCRRFHSGMRRLRRPLANGWSPRLPKIIPGSGSAPVRCAHSTGPQSVVPWYATRTVKGNPGFRRLQTIRLSGTLWIGPVKCCWSSINRCAPSQFCWLPLCSTWECCGCMTGSYRGSFWWQRDKGPWSFWWGPNSLRRFRRKKRRDTSGG